MKPGESKVVILGGKETTVRVTRRPLKNDYGYVRGNEIVISSGLTPSEFRETFFHEALHRLFWVLDEDVVTQAAKELEEAWDYIDND